MAIDFDGTNDGFNFTLPGAGFWYLQGNLQYDAGTGNRTKLMLRNTSSGDFIKVYRPATTAKLEILVSSAGGTRSGQADIAVSAHYRFQAYAYNNAGAAVTGIRAMTPGSAPGSFAGGSAVGSPVSPTCDAGHMAQANGSEWFNGRLSHVYLATFGPWVGSEFDALADAMARGFSPLDLLPALHRIIVEDNSGVHYYWPLVNSSDLTDVISGLSLSALDAPGSSPTDPQWMRRARGGRRVIVPAPAGGIVPRVHSYRRRRVA